MERQYFTVHVAVTGQTGVPRGGPIVVLSAALTVGALGVVPAVQTAPPMARAAVLLHIKHTLLRSPAAIALCGVGRDMVTRRP